MSKKVREPVQTSFIDLYEMIMRRKITLIVSVASFISFALVYSYSATPLYQASAQLLIESDTPQTLSMADLLPKETREVDFLATQYALIKSRSLIKDVIIQLELDKSPEFVRPQSSFSLSGVVSSIKETVYSILPFMTPSKRKGDGTSEDAPDYYSKYVDEFQARLKVLPVSKTRIVRIEFLGYSPSMTAKISNTVAELYIRRGIESRSTVEGDTGSWLRKRVDELNKAVKKSEMALQKFKETKSIIELEEGKDLNTQKLKDTIEELSRVKSERLNMEALIVQLNSMNNDPKEMMQAIPDSLKSKAIFELIKEYNTLQGEWVVASQKLGPEHPSLKTLKRKMSALEKRIPEEMDRLIRSVKVSLNSIKVREKILQKGLDKQKKGIIDMGKESIQYKVMKQEAVANRKLFDMLLGRMKELKVSSNFNRTNIQIVDPAEIPIDPVKPNKKLNFLVSLMSGTLFGVMLIFIREGRDRTVKRLEDFGGDLPFSLLGTVHKATKGGVRPILNDDPSFAGEIQGLGLDLLKTINVFNQKIFLMSSMEGDEGKATLAFNLGVALSRLGKRVAIVDADFQNSKITELMNFNSYSGLLDLFSSREALNSVARKTEYSGVWVIPTGKRGTRFPAVTDGIKYENVDRVFDEIRNHFDLVFIVGPPTTYFFDHSLLEKQSDGILFVVKSGKYDLDAIRKGIGRFSLVSSSVKKEGNGKDPSRALDVNDSFNVARESVGRMGIIVNLA